MIRNYFLNIFLQATIAKKCLDVSIEKLKELKFEQHITPSLGHGGRKRSDKRTLKYWDVKQFAETKLKRAE